MGLLALTIVALLVTLSSCSLDTTFKSGLEHFSHNIFHEIVKKNSNKNIIFSPFSAQTCLAMVRMGADGVTAAEMDNAMGFTGKSVEFMADNYYNLMSDFESSPLVKLANKVYVMDKYELKENFKKILAEKFFSSAENINFAENTKAAVTMNEWIESKTNNLIKDVITPDILSSSTRLVLINAIHFKGDWLKPFDVSKTNDRDFYLDKTNTVSVKMMHTKDNFEFGYFADIAADAVRLPYKDSDLSMLIFLPHVKDGLMTLEGKLKEISLESLTQQMKHQQIQVSLPKFKAEFKIKLNDPLKELNMKHLFEGANLSKMLSSPEPLGISYVIQKAFIEVTETGTEAAAATAAIGEDRSLSPTFAANRPFHYVIVNTENVVLFQGNVVNPSLQ